MLVHCVFFMYSAKDVSSLNLYKGIIEATSDYFPSLYSNWARNNHNLLYKLRMLFLWCMMLCHWVPVCTAIFKLL
jgi:hypothetical protein